MLKAVISHEEFQGLSESDQAHYQQGKDGRYYTQIEATAWSENGKTIRWALENVEGLRTALTKERARADEEHRQVQELTNSFEGLDPDVARTAIKKVEELGDTSTMEERVKQQIEAATAQIQASHAKKLKSMEETISQAQDRAAKTTTIACKDHLAAAAREVFAHPDTEVLPEWHDVMLEKIRVAARCEMTEAGEFRIFVPDADGNARISTANGAVQDMGLMELAQEFKSSKSLARCFTGTQAAGSGAGSNTQSRIPANTVRAGDREAVQNNLDAIATGKVKVIGD